MVNVREDEVYKDYLLYCFFKNKLASYEAAMAGNAVLSELKKLPDFDSRLHKLRFDVNELKEKELHGIKFKSVDIKKRTEFADMLDIYQSIYHRICPDSHNGLEALNERHEKTKK